MHFLKRLFCSRERLALEQLQALRGSDDLIDEILRRIELHVEYCVTFGIKKGSWQEQMLHRIEGDWMQKLLTDSVRQQLQQRQAERSKGADEASQ